MNKKVLYSAVINVSIGLFELTLLAIFSFPDPIIIFLGIANILLAQFILYKQRYNTKKKILPELVFGVLSIAITFTIGILWLSVWQSLQGLTLIF